jgi:DNA-binding protein HU-beta
VASFTSYFLLHCLPRAAPQLSGMRVLVRIHNGLTVQHSCCPNPINHDQIVDHAKLKPARELMAIAKKVAKTAKKAAPAKAAAQATITLKHLAAALADSHEIAKKQAEAMLGDLVTLTTRHLKKGDKIRLTGLGILQVRKRAARMGRNPATGEAIKIKASKKIAFRPAKELKEAV